MYTIITPNTNTAMPHVYSYLHYEGIKENSRNGLVLRAPEPVAITYTQPMERVNFCPVRDANPFFHLAEAMWMLAGKQDSASMEYYLPNFADYADNGVINAAYGHRARVEWGDQFNIVIDELKKSPTTRQAVVQLWSPTKDLGTTCRDKACNMSLVFQRNPKTLRLDMHINNRSNDALWGGVSGANVVHMAFFLEYVAFFARMEPGYIHVYSANLHAYLSNNKLHPLMGKYAGQYQLDYNPYTEDRIEWVPLLAARTIEEPYLISSWASDQFTLGVLWPMVSAHTFYKKKRFDKALEELSEMPEKCDWKIAAIQWLERRLWNS